jgi:glycosyltransferase involved in cell wall biosynthesis
MIFEILMDMGKLKTPFSGLGQFSYYYGKHILNLSSPYFNWNFLVPSSMRGVFNKDISYEETSLKRRFFPFLCRKYQLWHALHQDSSFLPGDKDCPYILTIHDLNFLKEKDDRKAERRLKKLQSKVNRASAITFVSNYTASISKKNLNLAGKDLYVIHNGVEIDTEKKVQRPSYLPEGTYLFALGMVLKKKNFHVLIDFIRQLPKYNLVIAGDNTDAYAKKIMKEVRKYNLQRRVVLPGIISEDDKIYLYRHCESFLFPSILEGFGFQVIEAMRFGKPVFLSREASLPEIGANMAFFWNSFDPGKMADLYCSKLEYFKSDKENLERKLIEHSNRYNWDTSIREYYNMYVSVINKHYRYDIEFIR